MERSRFARNGLSLSWILIARTRATGHDVPVLVLGLRAFSLSDATE